MGLNLEVVVVNMNTISVFDFIRDGESEKELLDRAYKCKKEEVEFLERRVLEYPNDKFFKSRLSAEKKTEYRVMSYKEFEKLERDYYISKPLVEITEEEYNRCLNVLPPLQWCTIDGVEMFCMREMYTSTYTSQYAKVGDKYYSKMVDYTDKSTWIHNFLK